MLAGYESTQGGPEEEVNGLRQLDFIPVGSGHRCDRPFSYIYENLRRCS
jgi:hypothetical protein